MKVRAERMVVENLDSADERCTRDFVRRAARARMGLVVVLSTWMFGHSAIAKAQAHESLHQGAGMRLILAAGYSIEVDKEQAENPYGFTFGARLHYAFQSGFLLGIEAHRFVGTGERSQTALGVETGLELSYEDFRGQLTVAFGPALLLTPSSLTGSYVDVHRYIAPGLCLLYAGGDVGLFGVHVRYHATSKLSNGVELGLVAGMRL